MELLRVPPTRFPDGLVNESSCRTQAFGYHLLTTVSGRGSNTTAREAHRKVIGFARCEGRDAHSTMQQSGRPQTALNLWVHALARVFAEHDVSARTLTSVADSSTHSLRRTMHAEKLLRLAPQNSGTQCRPAWRWQRTDRFWTANQ
jgi:hypothetical protein